MAIPPNFNASYMNTWEYIFFPEHFEEQENIRRGITPQPGRNEDVPSSHNSNQQGVEKKM